MWENKDKAWRSHMVVAKRKADLLRKKGKKYDKSFFAWLVPHAGCIVSFEKVVCHLGVFHLSYFDLFLVCFFFFNFACSSFEKEKKYRHQISNLKSHSQESWNTFWFPPYHIYLISFSSLPNVLSFPFGFFERFPRSPFLSSTSIIEQWSIIFHWMCFIVKASSDQP